MNDVVKVKFNQKYFPFPVTAITKKDKDNVILTWYSDKELKNEILKMVIKKKIFEKVEIDE